MLSYKALTFPEKQGLLRKEVHTKYVGKGGASAHKLKFMGVSLSPLSEIQITWEKITEGMKLSYLS